LSETELVAQVRAPRGATEACGAVVEVLPDTALDLPNAAASLWDQPLGRHQHVIRIGGLCRAIHDEAAYGGQRGLGPVLSLLRNLRNLRSEVDAAAHLVDQRLVASAAAAIGVAETEVRGLGEEMTAAPSVSATISSSVMQRLALWRKSQACAL
jgi:hypothetical protein